MIPRVLMVTGAYPPEFSGAGLQCRSLIGALRGRAACSVLTTSADPCLPAEDRVDGIAVCRVHIDVRSLFSRLSAAFRFCRALLRLQQGCDIIHLHGFSQKSLLVVMLAKCFGKKIILKLTSAGDDDPLSIRARQRRRYRWYAKADAYVGVSPRLGRLYAASGLAPQRFQLIPNGVDLQRFSPADEAQARAARKALGLSGQPWTLCVGFFSREKHPDVLYAAWRKLRLSGCPAGGLIFVGATRGAYHELDSALAENIREDARRCGLAGDVVFVERAEQIERYYRAASFFALPSSREGLPNALLEAMACGLPCIATRIAGVTDSIITDGVNGLLVAAGDSEALACALRRLVDEPGLNRGFGRQARQAIEQRYGLPAVAESYLKLYRSLRAEDAASAVSKSTAQRFGFLWSRSLALRPEKPAVYHYEQMAGSLGLAAPQGLVLDAGCGEGIDLANQAALPGVTVVGVELSEGGCRISARRTAAMANARVVQADLCRLPFDSGLFDHVYSYGVVHHMEKTEQAVAELARVLKGGGRCLIYVYEDFSERPALLRWMLAAANSLRAVTTRMPAGLLFQLCRIFSPVVYVLFALPYQLFKRIPPLQGLAEQIPFRHAAAPFSLTGDLYDRFSAPIEKRYSRLEAMVLLEQAGLEAATAAFARGWVVTAVKPQEAAVCAA